MNELMVIEGQGPKKMTSLEISELVESRHDKVKQSIERLVSRAVIELPPTGEISTATKPVKVYLLDKRSSLIVVAQLCPEFTARIVDRWQELEAQAAPVDPSTLLNDPAWLRGSLLTYTEKVIALEHKIQEQVPTVEAFSRFAKSEGSFNLTSSAKLLNIKPMTLTDYLASNRYIYKRAGSKHWVAYQSRVEEGVLKHKTFNYVDSLGFTQSGEQVMVTTKGLAHLGVIFAGKPQQHVSGFKKSNRQMNIQ